MHCGRPIAPRRMSAWNWEQLRYCSTACRRQTGAQMHQGPEASIVGLLQERTANTSICPSEAAWCLFGDRFREHMEDVRRAARRMAWRGEVVITQGGKPFDPATMRGPMRIAAGPQFSAAHRLKNPEPPA